MRSGPCSGKKRLDIATPRGIISAMATDFLQKRIDATEALIEAYEAALLAFTVEGVQQYTMDTGQSRVVVTKASISSLERALNSLTNRYYTLIARRGTGSTTLRPAW